MFMNWVELGLYKFTRVVVTAAVAVVAAAVVADTSAHGTHVKKNMHLPVLLSPTHGHVPLCDGSYSAIIAFVTAVHRRPVAAREHRRRRRLIC